VCRPLKTMSITGDLLLPALGIGIVGGTRPADLVFDPTSAC
jgi:hypothetical protein